jgi:glycosyltransferase involved in cell wall biosynthesis
VVAKEIGQQLGERRFRLGPKATILSFFDTGLRTRKIFQEFRTSSAYKAAFLKSEPLVSVCIGTYNRAQLLLERAVPSILNQTYEHLEVIVVGDACTDDTRERLAALRDPRLKFANLPRRGDYPTNPSQSWMVAGTASMNHALSLAGGDFITHLDDDDEHALDRVEKLIGLIRETEADIVFHPFQFEGPDAKWKLNEAREFRGGAVTTSSVLYHNWFRQLDWDPFAYRFNEPGDWSRFRRMNYLGVRAFRFPEPLLRHYRERNQSSDNLERR